MIKLTQHERMAIVNRVKELNAMIQDRRLSMVRIDCLQKERTGLSKLLRDDFDRAQRPASPQPVVVDLLTCPA